MFVPYLVFFPAIVIAAGQPPERNALVNEPLIRSPDSLGTSKVISEDVRKMQGTGSDFICSEAQILADSCIYALDGFCDAGSLCDEQSDCFDCDPCHVNYLTCGSCVEDPACLWCEGYDPLSGLYVGSCNSAEMAQLIPTLCGDDSPFGSVCPDSGSNFTSTCDIFADDCLSQFDLICDSGGDSSSLCTANTDCFDCDPCQNIVNDAYASNIFDPSSICNLCTDAGCTYCTAVGLDGSNLAVCTSPYLASVVPNICMNTGGSPFQNTCSSAGVDPTPAPISGNFSQTCDYSNDSCIFAVDGECDAGTGSFLDICDPNTDCFDCDPCQQLRFDGCDACVSAGCFWCPLDSLCLSANPVAAGVFGNSSDPFQKVFSCTSADDFTQTCPASNSNLYNDPLNDAQNWIYDIIHVTDVWKSGITGAGIGIRINDDGVDATHPEISSKFIVESSCSKYLPVLLDSKHSHGTTCTSLAAGSGNNGVCSVGIAPNASISGCRIILTDLTDELASEESDASYLYTKMENMHVSSNSYGVPSCQPDTTSLFSGKRANRRLQQCPFTAPDIAGTSPCAATECANVDWFNPSPSTSCEDVIRSHCLSFFESDVLACTSFLDLFVSCRFNSLTLEEQFALSKGVTEGRDGKGIVYVFAAGNDFDSGADVNFAGWQSSRFVMVVGAIDKSGKHSQYSTSGAALFISAPGGDLEYFFNNAVALAGGTCTDGGAGTSFAAPIVAGVVALILEAAPDLSWRDVQGVLASTSTMILPNDPSWVINAAGLHHSNIYGFGLVNASAAVALSRNWITLTNEIEMFVESGEVNVPIPDFPSDPVTSSVVLNANVTFQVETVAAYLDLYHSSRGELRIILTSPSGTKSVLSPGQRPENAQFSERWKLTSVRFRGEAAAGNWTLSIVDQSAGDVSTCVDYLDWSTNITFLTANGVENVTSNCPVFQSFGLCENGTETLDFYANFPGVSGLSDPCLADADGITPDVACCECGGGRAASSLQDLLVSWRLVVYGNDPASVSPPPAGPPPTSLPPQAAPSTLEDPTPAPITAPVPTTNNTAPVPISTTGNVPSSPVVRPSSPTSGNTTASSSGGNISMPFGGGVIFSLAYYLLSLVFMDFVLLH